MVITRGIKPYFKLAALLGVGAMIYDTWLSGKFGASISLDMMGIYALISIASGLLLVIARYFWVTNHKTVAWCIMAGWAPVLVFNILSNMGVATANRMTNVQEASIQQARHNGAQQKVAKNSELLATFTKQLEDLKAKNPWAATVSADALRAQLPGLNLAIDQEAKRGGCGPKCLARTQERDEVQSKIAIAEQSNKLTTQIASLQKLVNDYTDAAAKTDAGISHAANQSTFYAKLINFSLYAKPGQDDIGVANESMGVFTAIVLAILSALLTYVGAYPHLLEAMRRTAEEAVSRPLEAIRQVVPSVPAISHVAAAPQPEAPPVGFIPTTAQSAATATRHGDYLAKLMAGAGASRVALGSA